MRKKNIEYETAFNMDQIQAVSVRYILDKRNSITLTAIEGDVPVKVIRSAITWEIVRR